MGLTENMISLKAPVGAIGPFCNPYFTDQQHPQERSNLGQRDKKKFHPRVPWIRYSKASLVKMLD